MKIADQLTALDAPSRPGIGAEVGDPDEVGTELLAPSKLARSKYDDARLELRKSVEKWNLPDERELTLKGSLARLVNLSGPGPLGNRVGRLSDAMNELMQDMNKYLPPDRIAAMTSEDVPGMLNPVANSLKKMLQRATALRDTLAQIEDEAGLAAERSSLVARSRQISSPPSTTSIEATAGADVLDAVAAANSADDDLRAEADVSASPPQPANAKSQQFPNMAEFQEAGVSGWLVLASLHCLVCRSERRCHGTTLADFI